MAAEPSPERATERARASDRADGCHPDRLPSDPAARAAVLAAHAAAVDAGQDGYLDPVTGLFVLTAAYLADRGRCCGSGCRHCPYDG